MSIKEKSYHIKNALILNSDFEIEAGEVLIEGGVISAVGKLDKVVKAEVVDAKGGLVMPGLKNAHTHSAMTLLRGYAENLPLKRWLFESVFPFEKKMTEEDVYWGTKLANLEYLRNGITEVGEMYFFADGYIRAFKEDGIRATVVCAAADIDGDTESALEKIEQLYRTNFGKGVRVSLGYHAEYTASDALLGGLAELAKAHRAPVCCHMSETALEVANAITSRGHTPFKLADKFGLFDHGGVVYHGVYLSGEEQRLAAERNVSIVTNPSSNLKLASGIAPILDMIKNGVRVAIGTDGAASNNALDMFREMYLVSVLQKYKSGNADAMPPKEVLKMCIENGAIALNPSKSHSGQACVAVGNAADLIIVDVDAPNMMPHHDLISNLVYSCSGANVKMTMIDGQILYKDGEYTGINKQEVYLQCNKIINRIKSQL